MAILIVAKLPLVIALAANLIVAKLPLVIALAGHFSCHILRWTSSQIGFSPALGLDFVAVWFQSGSSLQLQSGVDSVAAWLLSTGPPRSLQPQSMPNISFQLSLRFSAWPGLRLGLASVRQQSSASTWSGLRRSLASVLQVPLAVFSFSQCRTSASS